MKVFSSDAFVLPLPPGHRFPMEKYAMLRERVVSEGIVAESDVLVPDAASDEQLLRVHDAAYLQRVVAGELSAREVREIGFPWSPALVERSRRSTGATIAACRAALEDGVAVNLAGGTHHAFRDRGEGYCVFNDAAVAARELQASGRVRRVAIVDLDVHQGNGTAAIFAGDDTVFTLSVHGARNYPFHKEASDIDVELPDGSADDACLEAIERGVSEALSRARAGLVIYLAGADPYEGDRLGRLAMTKAGLEQRDALVLDRCRASGLPVAIAMAGGYAHRIENTVDIHVATVRAARARDLEARA